MQLMQAPDDILAGKLRSVIEEILASYTGAGETWVKYTKTYSQFSTAGTSNTIALATLPAKAIVSGVVIYPSTTFSGGAIATYTVDVIHPVSGSLLLNSVFTGGVVARTSVGVDPVMSGTTAMTVTATSTGANLNAATQGSADIYLLYATLT